MRQMLIHFASIDTSACPSRMATVKRVDACFEQPGGECVPERIETKLHPELFLQAAESAIDGERMPRIAGRVSKMGPSGCSTMRRLVISSAVSVR